MGFKIQKAPDVIKKAAVYHGLTEASALIPPHRSEVIQGQGLEAKGKFRPVGVYNLTHREGIGDVPPTKGN